MSSIKDNRAALRRKRAASKSPSLSPSLHFASSTPSSITKTDNTRLPPKIVPMNDESPLRLKPIWHTDRSHRNVCSSPIRKPSLPSPESPQVALNGRRPYNPLVKSSPLKKKRVVFSEDLVKEAPTQDIRQLKLGTPVKSILKSNIPNLSRFTDTVNFTTPSPEHGQSSPNRLDFWSPGNIPRLSANNSTEEEIASFKALLKGGLTVLENPSNSKQFEIYATFYLLLKELNEMKLNVLFVLLNDLLRLARRDLAALKEEIQLLQEREANNSGQDKTPFLVRTSGQIIKVLNILFSNERFVTAMCNGEAPKWAPEFIDVFRWTVNHVCELIIQSNIAKSLLSACLQLLKDSKLYSFLSIPQHELILYSLLNTKKRYSTSASLTIEKFSIFKLLIQKSTPMMEKNSKDWINYFISSICSDLDTPGSQNLKSLTVISSVLLEAAKVYLQSKSVNFEVTTILSKKLAKFLDLESELPQASSQAVLFLCKTTFSYLTDRLTALVKIRPALAMDLWVSITLLFYGNPLNLKSQFDTAWISIVNKCLESDSADCKVLSIKAWRSIIYVTLNSVEENHSELEQSTQQNIRIMFDFFAKLSSKNENSSVFNATRDLQRQLLYGLLNNRGLARVFFQLWDIGLLKFLNCYFLTPLEGYSLNHADFIYLMSTKSDNPDYILNPEKRKLHTDFYLMNIFTKNTLKIKDVEPFNPVLLFMKFPDFYSMFLENFWKNTNATFGVKFKALSVLLSKVKHALSIKELQVTTGYKKTIYDILGTVQSFLENYYLDIGGEISRVEKLGSFSKFTLLMKTNFGSTLFQNYESLEVDGPYRRNIYLTLIQQALKHDVKVIEVFKFILIHNKTNEYKFMELLLLEMKSWPENHDLQKSAIVNFVGNNLESKIFDTLSKNELESVMKCVDLLDKKTPDMMSNVLSLLLKTIENHETPGAEAEHYFQRLDFTEWTTKDIFALIELVSVRFSNSPSSFTPSSKQDLLKGALLGRITAQFQGKDAGLISRILPVMISNENYAKWTWLVISLKEHVFFHVIDPKNLHSPEEYQVLQKSFVPYLSILKLVSAHSFDEAIAHGLKVCSFLASGLRQCSIVGDYVLRALEVEKQFYIVLKDVDWDVMTNVKLFLESNGSEIFSKYDESKAVLRTSSKDSSGQSFSDSAGDRPTLVIEGSSIDDIEEDSEQQKHSLDSIDEVSQFEKETTDEVQVSDENPADADILQSRELEKFKQRINGDPNNSTLLIESPPNSSYVDASDEIPDRTELPKSFDSNGSIVGTHDIQLIEEEVPGTLPTAVTEVKESGSLELTTEGGTGEDENSDDDCDDIQALEKQEYDQEMESFRDSQLFTATIPVITPSVVLSTQEVSDSNSPLGSSSGEFPLVNAKSHEKFSESPFLENNSHNQDKESVTSFTNGYTDTFESRDKSQVLELLKSEEKSPRKRSAELDSETLVKRNRPNEIQSSPLMLGQSSPTPVDRHSVAHGPSTAYSDICNTLDALDDSSFKDMTDREVFEVENKLLRLIMRIRETR